MRSPTAAHDLAAATAGVDVHAERPLSGCQVDDPGDLGCDLGGVGTHGKYSAARGFDRPDRILSGVPVP